ncbi:serine hydrolase domain-containing protein [Dyadobacter fermentans]|nr:serine hydrolase domain-containing protein [Dyadobacter fermentans]
MKRLLSLIVALFSVFSVAAQQINTADLDRLLDSLTVHNQSMASVAMLHKGVKIYERAIGYAVIDSTQQVKATPATKYRIGSITKTFTATMIMQLVEEQKLTLDTRLDKYFPSIPEASQITIEMMLRHRSGIHNFTDDAAYWETMTQPKTRAQMLAAFEKSKSDFTPGTTAQYSNTGYVLLGYVIEDITQKSYEKNLQERILSPLGLKNTRFGGKIDPAAGDAHSYTFSKQWDKREETSLTQPLAAGAIVSTAADVATFYEGLFSGKLVSKESLTKMTTLTDMQGLGLARTPFYQRMGYGHSGGLDGFHSVAAYYPADSLSAVVLSNGVDYGSNDILIATLSTFYKAPVTIPDFRAMDLKPEELDAYVGEYASQQIPQKVTISRENRRLFMHVAGQPALRLTPVKKDVFKFDSAALTIEFRSKDGEFTLTQGGAVYVFKK